MTSATSSFEMDPQPVANTKAHERAGYLNPISRVYPDGIEELVQELDMEQDLL